MNRLIIILIAGWLTACSSSEQIAYYQLATPPVISAATSQTMLDNNRTLWIEAVTIPDALAGTGIAVQTSDVQYHLATRNQWASPLDQQLQQTLIANLSALMPGWLVTNKLTGRQQDTLSTTVTAFQGGTDGQAIIKGYWLYQSGNHRLREPFALTVAQSADGYPALVQALSQGWYQQAKHIADKLQSSQ